MSSKPKEYKKIDFRKIAIGEYFDKELEIVEGNLNETIERNVSK